jgi:hypothetical protein
MRLKDGLQACPQCGGQGCYWCRHHGWRAQCPVCCNSEPEFLVKGEDELTCLACNSVFERGGQLLSRPPKDEPRLPPPRVVSKSRPKSPVKQS